MCPMCMTTAAVIAAGTASGTGVLGLAALKFRAWRRRRLPREQQESRGSHAAQRTDGSR